jgi:hypothetical protein
MPRQHALTAAGIVGTAMDMGLIAGPCVIQTHRVKSFLRRTGGVSLNRDEGIEAANQFMKSLERFDFKFKDADESEVVDHIWGLAYDELIKKVGTTS